MPCVRDKICLFHMTYACPCVLGPQDTYMLQYNVFYAVQQ